MSTKMIDSHAHLTSDALFAEIDPILTRAQEQGVHKVVNICTDLSTLERGVVLRKRYPWVYNAAATTPHDVLKEGETFFPIVEKHAFNRDLIAVGESGLDYYYEHSPKELQQHFLVRYCHLAKNSKLPLIIHCREAFEDLFSIADQEYQGCPAVLHCFTGTLDEAKKVIDRGWMISFSGIITFKKSELLREVVAFAPLDQILIETDAPYLAPQKYRGKQNEPAYVGETAQTIADVKRIDREVVCDATSNNARKFFSF